MLVYGKTDSPPYEYFVTIGNNREFEKPKQAIVFDTVLQEKAVRFIGSALTEEATSSLKTDLKNIFQSLEGGEDYRKEISSVMDVVQRQNYSNTFYAAFNEIANYPAYDKAEEWAKIQMELTFASFLGYNDHYEKLLAELESGFTPRDSVTKLIKEKSIANNDALTRIVSEAKDHRLVIINENHFYPNHRILLTELLPELKEIGYTHLALEALGVGQDSLLNLKDGFPTLNTGFYTREQHYGNLLRKAKALGFKFVAYESTQPTKDREIGQAENLYNKTFKLNPQAKVVVLAGIDHILEKPTKTGKKWMAAVLNEKYHKSLND